MSDDVRIGLDPKPVEAGAKRIVQAFKSISDGATKHTGDAGRSFSNLYREINKFSSLKGVNAGTLSSLQSLSSIMATLARSKGPSATAVSNIRGLSSALSGFKAPSAAQINNLTNFTKALSKITSTPGTGTNNKIAGLSAALSGFKAPSAAAANNLKAFFAVLNNAKFSTQLTSNLKNLSAAVNGLGPFAGLANRLAGALNNLNSAGSKTSSTFLNLKSHGLSLGQALMRTHAALEGMAAVLGARSIVKAATEFQKMELALKATLGTSNAASSEMRFAQETADKYGVSIGSLGSSYAQLLASAQGTNITIADSRRIFEGVTQAVRVYGLSTEDAEGVYRALTQMVSKGTVQMEELRGQLGDRLPGAVQVFAKGLGVTTAQLMKMTQAGQVSGDTLRKGLLGFADELKARTGGALTEAVNTLPAAFGRLQTAFVNFSAVVTKSGWGEGLIILTNNLSGLLSNTAVLSFLQGLGAGFKAVAENIGMLSTLLGASLIGNLLKMRGVVVGLSTATALLSGNLAKAGRGFAILQGMSTGAISGLGRFNIALLAIGVGITVITALADQFDGLNIAHKAAQKESEAMAGTMAAESRSAEALAESYKTVTGALREKERAKIQEAYKQSTVQEAGIADKAKSLFASENFKNTIKSGPLSQNPLDSLFFKDQEIAQNMSKMTASSIGELQKSLNNMAAAADAAGIPLGNHIKQLSDLTVQELSAKEATYNHQVQLNLLAHQSQENAEKNAALSTGFDLAAEAARNMTDGVNGAVAALGALDQLNFDNTRLATAIKNKDTHTVAAILGREGAPATVDAEASTVASRAAEEAYRAKFGKKTLSALKAGQVDKNPNTAGNLLYDQTKQTALDDYYASHYNAKKINQDLHQEGDILMGYKKAPRTPRTPRTPQNPDRVDRVSEALSTLKKYYDPAVKASEQLLSVNQAITELAKKNPEYLKRTTGETNLLKAEAEARKAAEETITETLAANIPEINGIVSAEKNYGDTVESINQLLETKSALITAAGGKEALIAAAKRRRDSAIAENEITHIKDVSDLSVTMATASLRKITAQGTAALAEIVAKRQEIATQFDNNHYGENQKLDLNSTYQNMGLNGSGGLATDEDRRLLQNRSQMLELEKKLSIQYLGQVDKYKDQLASAEKLLDVTTKMRQALSQEGSVDSLVSGYARPGENASSFKYERDFNEMSAMASKGTNPESGNSFGSISDASASRARNHLKEINNAFIDAQMASTKYGQSVSYAMQQAGDAIATFVTTGKLDFRGLITDIIAQVFRLAVIQPMVTAITRMIGVMTGGVSGLPFVSAAGNESLAGLFHTGGIVGESGSQRALRLHSGGMVPRGGVSSGNLRSWEYLTNLPKGAEVITQYDKRNQKNARFGETMQVLLKAGEEVLMPNDPRRNMPSFHTGGVVGGGLLREHQKAMSADAPAGGGVTIHNEFNIAIPAQASRGPVEDGKLVRQLAEEMERRQDAQLRTSLAYRSRNNRSMKVT